MASTYYVDKASSGEAAPYGSWATAAQELATVLTHHLANPDDATVWVRRGTYTTAYAGANNIPEGNDLEIKPEFEVKPYPVLPRLALQNTVVGGALSTVNIHHFEIDSLDIDDQASGQLTVIANNLDITTAAQAFGLRIYCSGGGAGVDAATIDNILVRGGITNGIYIFIEPSTCSVRRCTVYDTTTAIKVEEAVGGCTVNVLSNIVHTATTGINFTGLAGSTVSVSYNDTFTCNTDITGNIDTQTGNIDADPSFINLTSFGIYGNSPCAGTGDGGVDMGWVDALDLLPNVVCTTPLPNDKIAGNIQVLATVTSSAISYANGCPTHAQCCINNGELVTMSHQGNGLFKGHIRTAGYPNGTGTLHIYVESTGIGGNTAHSGVLVDLSNVDYSADAKGAYIGDHIGKGTEGIVWVEGAEPRKVPSPKGYRHRNLKFGMRRS